MIDIDTIPAGPEMDNLVGTRALRLVRKTSKWGEEGWAARIVDGQAVLMSSEGMEEWDGAVMMTDLQYSTVIRDAFTVLDGMIKDGFSYELAHNAALGMTSCTFRHESVGGQTFTANVPGELVEPLAICRAALRACGL